MKMASSRAFLLCGLLFAVLALMAEQVSARDLAEEIQSQESMKEANYDHDGPSYGYSKGHGTYGNGEKGYGGYEKGHGSYGHGGHGSDGHGCHGHHCGHHPPEDSEDVKN